MIAANLSLTFDPAWPWSLPGVGIPALLATAGALAALTIWTYLSAKGATWRRVGLILVLRLIALAVACFLVLRPTFAYEQEASVVPGKLIFIFDYSESMKITDEFDNLSRWENIKRILRADNVEAALKRLANEQRIEIVYYQGAQDLKKFDPEGEAVGKRTDMGLWLHELWQRHGREENLRGVLIFGDGIDNGTLYPTLDKAAAWRRDYRGSAPLHTWGTGRPTTSRNQKDIFFDEDRIFTEPAPVPVKGKFTIKAFAHAPGLAPTRSNVSLWLEGPDGKPFRAAGPQNIKLLKTRDNEVSVTCDAPVTPGEYKAMLKLDPVFGEITDQNNAITTYVTVTKEGVSVLWVEGRKRAFESVFAMRHALNKDPQFRIYYAEKLKEKNPAAEQADWFDFDKRHYDVIVIGDISAGRFSGNNPEVFKKIRKMVEKDGTGLLMLGGYETFGESDWHTDMAKDLAVLLPVTLAPQAGQIDKTPIKLAPSEDGLKYMLRVGTTEQASRDAWDKLDPLDGMTRMGKPLAGKAIVHAFGKDDKLSEPLLVSRDLGTGRTLVFGGDTTWRAWRRTKEGVSVYERFWTQMILWLARRDEAEGDIRLTLDKRRMSAGQGNRVEITVSLRGKGGERVDNGKVTVKVVGPNKEEFDVPVTAKGPNEFQGVFNKTHQSGEYQVVAVGEGVDAKGNKVGGPARPAKVRFLTYAQDLENLRTAADHEFLTKLARAGGGKFNIADERKLVQFLESLSAQQQALGTPKKEYWPDWRRTADSSDFGEQLEVLWNSTALGCLLVFVSLLCVEWFLRRRWGMV